MIPTDISGCTLWFDASQLGLADGAMVDTWPNLGSGSDATNFNVAPYRPTFRENIKNDLPVVRFIPGSGMRLAGTGIDLNYTLVYVAHMAPGVNSGRIVTATYPPANLLFGYWNGYEDIAYAGAFFTPDVRQIAGTAWHLYSADAMSVIEPAHTDYQPRLFSNGVFLSGNSVMTDGWKGTFNLNGYALAGGEETCDCEVAEVVMYDHKLSDVERQSVENYLRSKWITPKVPVALFATAPLTAALEFHKTTRISMAAGLTLVPELTDTMIPAGIPPKWIADMGLNDPEIRSVGDEVNKPELLSVKLTS